jgi:hypothetical protein
MRARVQYSPLHSMLPVDNGNGVEPGEPEPCARECDIPTEYRPTQDFAQILLENRQPESALGDQPNNLISGPNPLHAGNRSGLLFAFTWAVVASLGLKTVSWIGCGYGSPRSFQWKEMMAVRPLVVSTLFQVKLSASGDVGPLGSASGELVLGYTER